MILCWCIHWYLVFVFDSEAQKTKVERSLETSVNIYLLTWSKIQKDFKFQYNGYEKRNSSSLSDGSWYKFLLFWEMQEVINQLSWTSVVLFRTIEGALSVQLPSQYKAIMCNILNSKFWELFFSTEFGFLTNVCCKK